MQQLIAKYILIIGLVFSVSENVFAQKNWKEITSVEDLYASYPETLTSIFEQLNLEHQGLEQVKKAYHDKKMVEAGKLLLEYYRNANNAPELKREQPVKSDKREAEADTILIDVFVIQNVRGQVPYGKDDHRDWYYKGPNNDREWAWLSNRHTQINTVLTTYFETGNPIYVAYIDEFLRDFIIKSWPYPGVKSSTSVWRGLEVAARVKIWSRIFYGLINNGYISPATQLLILSSLPDHAHYNRNFHAGNNWLTMEISALATVAANFPEYKKSNEWLDYSIGAMTESMKDQVYEDGVQTELTSHYHNVSLHNFELFKDICDKANKQLPDFFIKTIERMYGYIARAMRPDGYRILNNDGDRGSDREIILDGANKFNNKEWEYIATNGKSGAKPADGPSYLFPWAGQMISRSGFDANAHWSFFDIGPWGSGHQHNDKLHISIAAYGRDLLVDAGRFAYTGEVAEKFRPYAKGSEGHNTILIDHRGQDAGPTHATLPLDDSHFKITDDFDYASGSFDRYIDVEGEVRHVRSVFYVRGEYWVVVDKIITDRPRKIDALWHWHPESVVEQDYRTVKTNNKRGNLAVIPVSKQHFDIKLVIGQETPEIQGWYSPEYNVFKANTTSFYSTAINGNTTMVWLLIPSENEAPKMAAKILSENENEVQIEVKSKENIWLLKIPFLNSKKADLVKR